MASSPRCHRAARSKGRKEAAPRRGRRKQPGAGSPTPRWGANGDSAPPATAKSLPKALRDKYTSTRAAHTAPNQPGAFRLRLKAAAGEKCRQHQVLLPPALPRPHGQFLPPHPHPGLTRKRKENPWAGVLQSRLGLSGKSVITDCLKRGLQPCREMGDGHCGAVQRDGLSPGRWHWDGWCGTGMAGVALG